MTSFIFINLNNRRGIKMRYYKFLFIMIVTSMLFLSVSAATGTQISIFSGEKLNINESIKNSDPLTINRVGGVFQSIISNFIKLIPTFIKTTFINGVSKESRIENELVEPEKEIIVIENPEDEIINIDEQVDAINEDNGDTVEDVIEENNNDVDNNPDFEEEVDNEDGNQQKGFELELTLELNQEYKSEDQFQ